MKDYIADKQALLDRLLTKAFEANEIDEVSYRRLSAMTCDSENWEDVFEHFESMLSQFLEAAYNHLLGRIVQGAEFIESLKPQDKRREAAMRKYDSLIEQNQKLRKWLYGT